jgi:hypothetical protein
MEIKAEIKTATKELVDALLAMNTKNRTVRKVVVDGYCSDISQGRWLVTNQGIGISSDGVLIDGQHRLEAIKKLGYPPVKLLIVSGLSPDAQLAVDTGMKRSARDLLYFAFDVRVSKTAPAICRNLCLRNKKATGRTSVSVYDIMETLTDYREEIEAVIFAQKSANFFAAAHLTGFVIVARECKDIPKVVEFMNLVEDGDMLQKGSPALALRNIILTQSARGLALIEDRILRTTRATTAYIEDREMIIAKGKIKMGFKK